MLTKKIIFTSVLFILIVKVAYFYLCYLENKKYEKQGVKLIDKIEVYRNQKNRLPNNVNDFGLIESMNEGPYYKRIDSINYIIFFNIGFDNKKTYNSQFKVWKDEPSIK